MNNVNYKYEGGFLAFIKDNGYTAYRTTDEDKLEKGNAIMSSIIPSGVATYFVHENELHLVEKLNNKEIDFSEFKKNIIWGLCEYGHPPGLINPRPTGTESRSVLDRTMSDVYFKDILEAMFNQNIILDTVKNQVYNLDDCI